MSQIFDNYGNELAIGDRVQYSARFLRDCGIVTGIIPRLRGRIVHFDFDRIAIVQWETPARSSARMSPACLHKLGTIEPNRKDSTMRPLYVIAREIRLNWNPVWFGAVPYLDAMSQLDKITDMYGLDDARYIVTYFLGNAQTWKGETARKIKAELKSMCK